MCHPKVLWLEPEERQEPPPTTMQQYVAYNQEQWLYYNELMAEVHHGIYGAYYNFLLAELIDGPYWSQIKAQLGQVQRNMIQRQVSVAQGSHSHRMTLTHPPPTPPTPTPTGSMQWMYWPPPLPGNQPKWL